MTDAELITRLRVDEPMCEEHFTANLAADRIEALIAERATCEKYRDAYAEMGRIGTQAVRDLEAKLFKTEAKLAENEVRLGKAVEALKMMCEEFRGYDLPYGSKAYSQATAALARVKGETK